MMRISNLILMLALICTVALIACNDQKQELQEMEEATVDIVIDELGRRIPVRVGHPLDDPSCRARTYNNGDRYCETLTPCPGGKTCEVVLRVSGHSCNCR